MTVSENDVFENEFMRLEWRSGIIRGMYKQGPITLEMAKKVVENRLRFANYRDVPIMIGENGLRSIEKDAREFLSSDEGIKGLKAGAIVTNSLFSRHLANFFIRISVIRPKIPTRLFSDEEEALEWLKQYI
jgi:hypothetical protein